MLAATRNAPTARESVGSRSQRKLGGSDGLAGGAQPGRGAGAISTRPVLAGPRPATARSATPPTSPTRDYSPWHGPGIVTAVIGPRGNRARTFAHYLIEIQEALAHFVIATLMKYSMCASADGYRGGLKWARHRAAGPPEETDGSKLIPLGRRATRHLEGQRAAGQAGRAAGLVISAARRRALVAGQPHDSMTCSKVPKPRWLRACLDPHTYKHWSPVCDRIPTT